MKKLFLVLSGLISFSSYAYDATQGALQNSYALCGYGYNPNCDYNGQRPPKKTIEYVKVYVPSKYGAIALNKKTGHTGAVINASSKAIAKRDAIKSCEQKAKDPCKIVTWVRNGCLAAVQGKIGKNATLFTAAEEPGLAESVAMQNCINAGAKQCQPLLPEGCSLPD